MATKTSTQNATNGSKPASTAKNAASAGGQRRKPGATGQGDYYHVEVRARSRFSAFRTQDVGEKEGLQRISGQKPDGSWETQAWLIAKPMAHVDETGQLVADHADAREVLEQLKGPARRLQGDRFRARREHKPPPE